MKWSKFVISSVMLGAACARPSEIIELGVPRLAAGEVWAGNDILIHSDASLDAHYVLVVGTDSLPLRQVDSTTWAARAPRRGGTMSVVLLDDDHHAVLQGEVTIRGFLDVREAPRVSGYPLPLSTLQGAPAVIMNGESSLVRVDLRYGTAIAWPSSVHDPDCMRGPGPTPTEGIYVTAHRSPSGVCTWSLWRLLPSVQKLADSIPIAGLRLAGMFDSNRFLVSPSQHSLCVESISPKTQSCRGSEEINGIRFSPRGDRAFVYYGYSNNVPVYDTQKGDTAFTIPDANASEGGSFTSEGDTLFLAVVGATARLLVLDARTGARYADLRIAATRPEGTPEDVLVDPQAPYVYVLVWRANSHPVIQVYDRRTSSLLAELPGTDSSSATADANLMCSQCDNRLVMDLATRQLYVLAVGQRQGRALPGLRSNIARFSLLRE